MDFNIGKIGGFQPGLATPQNFGATIPKAATPKTPQNGENGLVSRLNNINCELSPSYAGSNLANKLDLMA